MPYVAKSGQIGTFKIPRYRRHNSTGQAVVTLSGRELYLGPWNTKASKAEYDRLIGNECLAIGLSLESQ